MTDDISLLTAQLRAAYVDLADQAARIDSDVEATLSRFPALVSSPAARNERGMEKVPHNTREHRRREACLHGGFGDCVLYHSLKALRNYYQIVNGGKDRSHVDRLMEIAKVGLAHFQPAGNDTEGYVLKSENESRREGRLKAIKAAKAKRLQVGKARKRDEARHDTGKEQ